MVFGCMQGQTTLAAEYSHCMDKNEVIEIINGLQTGDVLLVKSHGFTAWGIRKTLATDWDHVAVVIRRDKDIDRTGYVESHKMTAQRKCSPDYCSCTNYKLQHDGIELLEATSAGIHVYPLEERLARKSDHDLFVAVRKLKGFDKNNEYIQKFTEEYIRNHHGIGYAFLNLSAFAGIAVGRNPLESENGVVKCGSKQQKPTSPIPSSAPSEQEEQVKLDQAFCSELAADFLMKLGVFKKTINAEAIGPDTFSSKKDAIKALLASDQYTYEKEEIILSPNGPGREMISKLIRKMKKQFKARAKMKKVFPQQFEEEPRKLIRYESMADYATNNGTGMVSQILSGISSFKRKHVPMAGARIISGQVGSTKSKGQACASQGHVLTS